ncbi:unnamed protein product [Amoebophrya sp. A120]|nr:unnamed protein product [Amoebophrya sp. A120]|eukprot:GSA120T00026128001.1
MQMLPSSGLGAFFIVMPSFIRAASLPNSVSLPRLEDLIAPESECQKTCFQWMLAGIEKALATVSPASARPAGADGFFYATSIYDENDRAPVVLPLVADKLRYVALRVSLGQRGVDHPIQVIVHDYLTDLDDDGLSPSLGDEDRAVLKNDRTARTGWLRFRGESGREFELKYVARGSFWGPLEDDPGPGWRNVGFVLSGPRPVAQQRR